MKNILIFKTILLKKRTKNRIRNLILEKQIKGHE